MNIFTRILALCAILWATPSMAASVLYTANDTCADSTGTISFYRVYVDGALYGTITPPSTTLQIDGLTGGQQYQFSRSCVDSAGAEGPTNGPFAFTPGAGSNVAVPAVGNCSAEGGLNGRTDIYFCEPFASSTWYNDHGYVDGQSPTPSPVNVANQLNRVSIVSSSECLVSPCLEGDWEQGVERTLAIVWPLKAANAADPSFDIDPEEMYMRYYLKFGPNWNSDQVSGSEGNGKLFGFADGRESGDPNGGQCGNGGATSDGINCWTARGLFWHCEDQPNDWAPGATCNDIANAQARLGSYIYAPNATETTGANGIWDGYGENQTRGSNGESETICRRAGPPGTAEHVAACYDTPSNNYYAGIGAGDNVVVNGTWYSIETYVKMNDPGVANGILRGWVDGVLVYEKTNMTWRLPGHDNLHIRTVWLDLYKGGISGNTVDAKSWVDQMVVAANYIGPINTSSTDTVGPVISNVSSGTPGSSTATISATTDEASTCIVEYGLTTGYGSTTSATAQGMSHSRILTGLTDDTGYNYRPVCTDTASNATNGSNQTFTTAPISAQAWHPAAGEAVYISNGLDAVLPNPLQNGGGQNRTDCFHEPWTSWVAGDDEVLMPPPGGHTDCTNASVPRLPGFTGSTAPSFELVVTDDNRSTFPTCASNQGSGALTANSGLDAIGGGTTGSPASFHHYYTPTYHSVYGVVLLGQTSLVCSNGGTHTDAAFALNPTTGQWSYHGSVGSEHGPTWTDERSGDIWMVDYPDGELVRVTPSSGTWTRTQLASLGNLGIETVMVGDDRVGGTNVVLIEQSRSGVSIGNKFRAFNITNPSATLTTNQCGSGCIYDRIPASYPYKTVGNSNKSFGFVDSYGANGAFFAWDGATDSQTLHFLQMPADGNLTGTDWVHTGHTITGAALPTTVAGGSSLFYQKLLYLRDANLFVLITENGGYWVIGVPTAP